MDKGRQPQQHGACGGDDLLEFVNHREKSALASSWRYELAGKTLEELLDGQVGLTVKDGKVEKL